MSKTRIISKAQAEALGLNDMAAEANAWLAESKASEAA